MDINNDKRSPKIRTGPGSAGLGAIWVSERSGTGFSELLQRICSHFHSGNSYLSIFLPIQENWNVLEGFCSKVSRIREKTHRDGFNWGILGLSLRFAQFAMGWPSALLSKFHAGNSQLPICQSIWDSFYIGDFSGCDKSFWIHEIRWDRFNWRLFRLNLWSEKAQFFSQFQLNNSSIQSLPLVFPARVQFFWWKS